MRLGQEHEAADPALLEVEGLVGQRRGVGAASGFQQETADRRAVAQELGVTTDQLCEDMTAGDDHTEPPARLAGRAPPPPVRRISLSSAR